MHLVSSLRNTRLADILTDSTCFMNNNKEKTHGNWPSVQHCKDKVTFEIEKKITAQSPDLNPIEILWDQQNCKKYDKYLTS